MLLPCAVRAQSDGFFKSGGPQNRETRTGTSEMFAVGGNSIGSNEDWATGDDIYGGAEPFQDAPLGSGIAVLTVLGTGYAVLRRRKK